ncbi:MAG TPA: hypothetical protein VL737_01220 [Candidatus Pristimantibacillus sp.]|nr:hypothetical protein [Candidatus Pristimantibacillus sp.]
MSQNSSGGETPFSFDPAATYLRREEALHWQFEDIGEELIPADGTILREWEEGADIVAVTHYGPVLVSESPLGNKGSWEAAISKTERINAVGVVSVRHSLVVRPADADARATTEGGHFRRPRLSVFQGHVAVADSTDFLNNGNSRPARQANCNAWLNIVTKSLMDQGATDLLPVTLPDGTDQG